MISPKTLKTLAAILNMFRPIFFAIVGGLVAGGMLRSNKSEPVNLVITNQHYEAQIRNIEKKQDSLANVLPPINQSLRYLSKHFPEPNNSSRDR